MFFRTMFEQLDRIGGILLLALIVGSFLYFVIAHQLGFKYKKKLFGTRRITKQSQEIPLEGNLFAAAYVRHNQPRVLEINIHHELYAAFLYRWYKAGHVQFVQLKPALETVNYLSIQKDVPIRDHAEEALYKQFCEAAGEDGLLDVDRAYEWTFRHPGEPFGCKPEEKGKKWLEKHDRLVPNGLIELQNYRQAAADEKPCAPVDVSRIDDLLVYAQLFGLTDKLTEAWKAYLTEEQKETVKLCKEIAEAFYLGNIESTE